MSRVTFINEESGKISVEIVHKRDLDEFLRAAAKFSNVTIISVE